MIVKIWGGTVNEPDATKAAHLQAIMSAGRRIHETIDTIDTIISARIGVHRNDLRCLHLLESGPTTPSHVAAHTGLTSGSVTALLDRLESAGLVERCRSTEDRRSVEVAIPEAQLQKLRALYAEIETAMRDYFGALDSNVIADTVVGLGRFAEALDSYVPRQGPAVCQKSPFPHD